MQHEYVITSAKYDMCTLYILNKNIVKQYRTLEILISYI